VAPVFLPFPIARRHQPCSCFLFRKRAAVRFGFTRAALRRRSPEGGSIFLCCCFSLSGVRVAGSEFFRESAASRRGFSSLGLEFRATMWDRSSLSQGSRGRFRCIPHAPPFASSRNRAGGRALSSSASPRARFR
jgi:hypothetical protein